MGGQEKGVPGARARARPRSTRRLLSPCLRAHSLRAAGVSLSRGLFENVLRDLLVERAEYTVQLFEGSGMQWRKARCGPEAPLARLRTGVTLLHASARALRPSACS